MSIRERTGTSVALAGGRALKLVRPPEPQVEEAPQLSEDEAAAAARRRSRSSLVRMMQSWSDAIDRDVRVILES